MTSGPFALRLDSFAFTTDSLNGSPPDDGKKYAVATVTAKNLTEKTLGMFEVEGGKISVAEGWRRGPTIRENHRLDATTIGPQVRKLLDEAAPPTRATG